LDQRLDQDAEGISGGADAGEDEHRAEDVVDAVLVADGGDRLHRLVDAVTKVEVADRPVADGPGDEDGEQQPDADLEPVQRLPVGVGAVHRRALRRTLPSVVRGSTSIRTSSLGAQWAGSASLTTPRSSSSVGGR